MPLQTKLISCLNLSAITGNTRHTQRSCAIRSSVTKLRIRNQGSPFIPHTDQCPLQRAEFDGFRISMITLTDFYFIEKRFRVHRDNFPPSQLFKSSDGLIDVRTDPRFRSTLFCDEWKLCPCPKSTPDNLLSAISTTIATTH